MDVTEPTFLVNCSYNKLLHRGTWLLPELSDALRVRVAPRLDSHVFTYAVNASARAVSLREIYSVKAEVHFDKEFATWEEGVSDEEEEEGMIVTFTNESIYERRTDLGRVLLKVRMGVVVVDKRRKSQGYS